MLPRTRDQIGVGTAAIVAFVVGVVVDGVVVTLAVVVVGSSVVVAMVVVAFVVAVVVVAVVVVCCVVVVASVVVVGFVVVVAMVVAMVVVVASVVVVVVAIVVVGLLVVVVVVVVGASVVVGFVVVVVVVVGFVVVVVVVGVVVVGVVVVGVVVVGVVVVGGAPVVVVVGFLVVAGGSSVVVVVAFVAVVVVGFVVVVVVGSAVVAVAMSLGGVGTSVVVAVAPATTFVVVSSPERDLTVVLDVGAEPGPTDVVVPFEPRVVVDAPREATVTDEETDVRSSVDGTDPAVPRVGVGPVPSTRNGSERLSVGRSLADSTMRATTERSWPRSKTVKEEFGLPLVEPAAARVVTGEPDVDGGRPGVGVETALTLTPVTGGSNARSAPVVPTPVVSSLTVTSETERPVPSTEPASLTILRPRTSSGICFGLDRTLNAKSSTASESASSASTIAFREGR